MLIKTTCLQPLDAGAESRGEPDAHDDHRDGVLRARRPQPRERVRHRLLDPDTDTVQHRGLYNDTISITMTF